MVAFSGFDPPTESNVRIFNVTPALWKVWKILLRFVVLGAPLIALATLIAHFAWQFSGSGRWELEIDRNDGVKVYSLKVPGSTLKEFKGTVKVRSALAPIVEAMHDPEVCKKIGCYEMRFIDEPIPARRYSTFRMDYPMRFRTREFVIRSETFQDPRNLEVMIVISAVPDKLPPSNCCFRVRDIYNTWRFTPLDGDEVMVEYTINMDEGGFLPGHLLNAIRPKFIHFTLSGMEKLVSEEKYRDAKFEFIQEVEAVR